MKNKAFGFYTAALTLILTVATLVAVLIYGSKGGGVHTPGTATNTVAQRGA